MAVSTVVPVFACGAAGASEDAAQDCWCEKGVCRTCRGVTACELRFCSPPCEGYKLGTPTYRYSPASTYRLYGSWTWRVCWGPTPYETGWGVEVGLEWAVGSGRGLLQTGADWGTGAVPASGCGCRTTDCAAQRGWIGLAAAAVQLTA